MEKYKLSKYTILIKNDSNHLILYNSLLGTKSICKIIDENIIKKIESSNFNSIENSIISCLEERNIIVEKSDDEWARFVSIFYDAINPKTLHLTINITEKCNFRCVYCYEKFNQQSMRIENMEKIILFVKRNIINFSGLRISWFGGEPLIEYKKIIQLSDKLISICKFYKRKYYADITTNGYLLTANIFQKLLNKRIQYFQITIDGTETIHNKQRFTINHESTFNTIIRNLKNIKNLKQKNFKICIRTNFTKEIFEYFSDYLNVVSYFCNDDKRFIISCYKVGNWGGNIPNEFKQKIINNSSNYMREIYSSFYRTDKRINLNLNYLEPASGLCYGGKKHNYLISARGTIHKCTTKFEEPSSIIGELTDSGNIQLNTNYYKLISNYIRCKNIEYCNIAPICTGDPCPYKSSDENKCLFIKDNLDLILKIYDKNISLPIIK